MKRIDQVISYAIIGLTVAAIALFAVNLGALAVDLHELEDTMEQAIEEAEQC